MSVRSIPLNTLNAAAFAPYGVILENLEPKAEAIAANRNEFRVIDKSTNSDGWRLAIYIVRERVLTSIEQHPDTRESFEPVSGVSVIVVAPPGAQEKLAAFVLDKPVVLAEGTWHAMLALSQEAIVKIAENNVLSSVRVTLQTPLSIGLSSTS